MAKMTKKDYELIASVINKTFPLLDEQKRKLVWDMADELEEQNSKFDRKKFLTACGIEE